jgi:hypothetical protein
MLLTCKNAMACISAISKVGGFCDKCTSVARADDPTKNPFEEKKFVWTAFKSLMKLLVFASLR